MTRIKQTQKELEIQLSEQLSFLKKSSDGYDAGDISEAKRIAVTLRACSKSLK